MDILPWSKVPSNPIVQPSNKPLWLDIDCQLAPSSTRVLITLTLCFWLVYGLSYSAIIAPSQVLFWLAITLVSGFMTAILSLEFLSQFKIRVSVDRMEGLVKGLFGHTPYYNLSWRWQDLHSVRLRKVRSNGFLKEQIRLAREFALVKHSWRLRVGNLLGGRKWMEQGYLMLDFTSGSTLALPLAGFSQQALHDFFMALTLWADPLSLNPEVISLQHDILSGKQPEVIDSYTTVWEKSLRQSFEVTNFVPLMSGHELKGGDLRILMLLACGGLSSVYLACNREGVRVVVKELSVPLDESREALEKVHEMFNREAEILAKIDHPRIVKVQDHFVENDRDYLVLEFVLGLTMRQKIQMSGVFDEEQVRKAGVEIAELLEYLHGFTPPIVHRDLTPDNLIVREPDQSIILIDFGAAHEFIGKVTGTLIGKQCYIPPEQFQGYAVPQSDLYAAGATMYFLATGQDPEPISASHPRHVCGNLSLSLDEVIARATCVNLAERIQSAKDLRRQIESRVDCLLGAIQ